MCWICGDYGLVTKLKPIKVSQFCQSNPASLFCPPFGLPKQKPAPVSRLTQCFSLLLWWSYLWQSLCFHAWAAPRAEGKTFKSTQAFISVSHRVRERVRVKEQARMRETERASTLYCCIKTMPPAKSIRFASQDSRVLFLFIKLWLVDAHSNCLTNNCELLSVWKAAERDKGLQVTSLISCLFSFFIFDYFDW